jgi:DNA polymerase III subunit epsilon
MGHWSLTAMAEQPDFWEQSDLLGLVSTPPPPAPTGPSPATASETAPSTATPTPVTPTPDTAGPPSASGVALPAFASTTPPRPTRGLPERLLILDTETTALSPDAGSCIEVGAVLFHVPTRTVLQQVSFLLPCLSNPVEHVNGIAAAVTRLEQPWPQALACFEAMVASADLLVAHNAAFDRQWFGHGPLPALAKPWICSMEDVPWPAELHLRANPSMRDLALAYGIPVWASHRALTDCTYLAQVLARCEDLEGLLLAAMEPRRLYRARLSYAERHLAKEAGFRWNEAVSGAWSRRLSQREAEALPFPVQAVEAESSTEPLPCSA